MMQKMRTFYLTGSEIFDGFSGPFYYENYNKLGMIYGVMHQIAMGNRSAIGAFLYPLPTELAVEISHNSALIHVVQYLCISFVRHGK